MPPGTQVYYISVSGNTENPGATNTGAYTVSVAEKAVLAPGTGADIEGGPTADKLTGTADSESIAGLGGDDTLYGLGGDDILDGNGGNDLLVGGAGGDTLKGGAGMDTISYAGSASGVTINLLSGTATGGDAEGDTLGTMIENVIGSMYGDMLTGTDDPSNGNGLWGLGGDDMLYGRDGPDMLYGGGGDDSLDGGDDMLFGGPGGGTAGENSDTLEGGGGDDSLYGGWGDDTLKGGAGDDTLRGGPGADDLLGGDDDDTIHADLSDDQIDGGAGMDTLSFAKVTGDDGVGSSTTAFRLAPAGTVADADGSGYNDGSADANAVADVEAAGIETVIGTSETDYITGANDVEETIEGGKGADMLDGGKEKTETVITQDWASYRDAEEGVAVNLNSGSGTGGEADGDTLKDIELVWGSTHGDTFIASDGADTIHGDGGNDTLNGGAGDDDLGGGAGNDTFVFGPGNGADVILSADDGFSATEDKIDLRAFGLTAEELTALISLRAGNAVINLSDHGGGTITIQSVTDLDTFETGANTTDDKIDTLSVWADNATGDNATDGDGIVQATEPGLFIL